MYQSYSADTPPAPTKYKNHRVTVEIISHAVWVYFRFCLSFRKVEEKLLEHGVIVTYEAMRKWWRNSGGSRPISSVATVPGQATRGIWMKCF